MSTWRIGFQLVSLKLNCRWFEKIPVFFLQCCVLSKVDFVGGGEIGSLQDWSCQASGEQRVDRIASEDYEVLV